MIIDTHPTPTANPLLWWLVVLVQSTVDPLQQDDYISRGRFSENILPMDIDVRARVEAVQHYAKVLMLDHSFGTWEPVPRSRIEVVVADLNAVDNTWIDAETDQRPPEDRDTRSCTSPAWKEMLHRLDIAAKVYLGGNDNMVLSQVRKLLTDH